MSISQQVGDVLGRMRQWLLGAIVVSGLNGNPETITAINKAGQVAQVGTITVDTAADSTVYTWTINGVVQTYTSGTGASTTTVAAGIAAVINADPLVRGQVSASAAVAVVTLTSTYAGVGFTASDSDSRLTTVQASTANANAAEVAFGRAVISQGFSSSEANRYAALPVTTNLAAQVSTVTITYAASEIYVVGITIAGQRYSVEVTATVDDATTAAAINTAINAMMPANTVIGTVATNVVTLTAEILGQPFVVDLGLKTGTTARAVLANTVTANTDLAKILLGVTAIDESQAYTTSYTAAYAANAAMRILRKGQIAVSSTQAISENDAVYVETSGSSAGLLYNSSSATRVRLDLSIAKWVRDELSVNNQSLALLALNLY
jgi:phage tail sheath gpL-like